MTLAAPPLARPAARPRTRLAALVDLLGLVALAAALRLPDFMAQPGFTDEALEVTRAALIAQGRLQSVTNVTPFISSLFNYLLAGAMVLVGPSVELPRAFMVACGALTVGAAYLLAREWGGRPAGLFAGLLLATNAAHILVNSRIAYSNCTTPLFTTLAFWQLSRAVRRQDGPTLIRAGLLFGLALLTHPSVLTLLPAAAACLLWQGGGLRRGRWPLFGAAAFLLVTSPLLIYNLATDFDSIRGLEHTGTMDRGKVLGPTVYLENLGGYALMLLRTTIGQVDRRGGLLAYLLDPLALVWLALGLIGAVTLVRRGNRLPALLVPGSLLVAALFSANSFEPVQPGRYVMPTVVAILAAIGVALGGLWSATRPALAPLARRLGVLALLVLLGGSSLLAANGYEDRRVVDNRAMLAAVATIEAARGPDEPVLLDHQLTLRRWGSGAVPSWIVDMLLTIRRVPFVETEADPDAIAYLLGGRPSGLIVLDDDSLPRLRDRFTLTRLALLSNKPARNDQTNKHAVYRLATRG